MRRDALIKPLTTLAVAYLLLLAVISAWHFLVAQVAAFIARRRTNLQ